jgi:ribosomal protein L11 methyltransferase
MHQWRKLAEPRWLSAHEHILQARAHGRLVIISRPGRKRLQLEIACTSRHLARKFIEEFGGHAEKLPRNWLKRFTDPEKRKPLKIGARLEIANSRVRAQCCSVRCPQRIYARPARPHALRTAHTTALVKKPRLLVIPASAAFGTGEHATTAMSLCLLERLTREWKNRWSLADLGTGSGILALAAKRFGAGRVVGIDVDPKSISVAKANAGLNKIDNVDFKLGDLRKWKSWTGRDIVAANLYSELLIEILPKLKRSNWLILSGVLRIHENKFLHALRRNKIEIVKVNRRGKWIAVLAMVQHASRLRIRQGETGSPRDFGFARVNSDR